MKILTLHEAFHGTFGIRRTVRSASSPRGGGFDGVGQRALRGDADEHALDGAGNKSTGTFVVKVPVQWGGFLPPVNPNGTSRFTFKQAVPVQLTLTGPSHTVKITLVR